MEEKLKNLYQLCETVDEAIADATQKLRSSGGKLSAGDLDYIDKLTHTLKSIKATIAMIESEDSGYSNYGNSRRSYNSYNTYRGSYDDGERMGDSYAYRGRSMRRDSMGRYSGDGYSGNEEIHNLIDELREKMDQLPDEKRREVQKFVDKMDRM